MKLLLDEMWTPAVASALRDRGHDVIAVIERPELRGRDDESILNLALFKGRVIVTENVADYRPLAAAAARAGRSSPGLIFTSDRAFPRESRRTVGRLVDALDALMTMEDRLDGERWLQRLD